MKKEKRKSVTMEDIAKAVGVSKNAVSLALSNKPGISDTIRDQIQQTAQILGYRNTTDRAEKKGCLVVLVPEYIRSDGAFYSDIFWAVEHESRKQGFFTLTSGLSAAMEKELILPKETETLKVLGYLAIGIIRKEYLEMLHSTGKQVVCVDICCNSPLLSSVTADNLYGGFLATDYLIRNGHKRIGFVGPIFNAPSVFERWCGYQRAMMMKSMEIPENCNILGKRNGFELLDNFDILEKYLADVKDMPTAWFCAGDMIAISMLKLLKSRGYRIPEDISIISFDDLKVAEMVSPALTTIHVDRSVMSKQSVHQLLNQIFSSQPVQPVHISIPCYLVERQSVAPLSDAD